MAPPPARRARLAARRSSRSAITIKQYPDSPAHVDGPMTTTQDASQHTGNASEGRSARETIETCVQVRTCA
eukprot:5993677-Prymnesium_polylepis.1